jgi:arabinose-5-phosphate isomerase
VADKPTADNPDTAKTLRWNESLELQIRALTGALASLSRGKGIERLIDRALRVEGFQFFTGVGKNGFVAEKVASTFNSLGIRSMFVDPVNTLHGDMNIFEPTDFLYSISKSGETEELVRFHRALHANGFTNICLVTSKPNSSLAQLSEMSLIVPVSTEADHLDLAPVASSVVFMAVLQAVGVELSARRGFSRSDFVKGHPGGALGKTRLDDESR